MSHDCRLSLVTPKHRQRHCRYTVQSVKSQVLPDSSGKKTAKRKLFFYLEVTANVTGQVKIKMFGIFSGASADGFVAENDDLKRIS